MRYWRDTGEIQAGHPKNTRQGRAHTDQPPHPSPKVPHQTASTAGPVTLAYIHSDDVQYVYVCTESV